MRAHVEPKEKKEEKVMAVSDVGSGSRKSPAPEPAKRTQEAPPPPPKRAAEKTDDLPVSTPPSGAEDNRGKSLDRTA